MHRCFLPINAPFIRENLSSAPLRALNRGQLPSKRSPPRPYRTTLLDNPWRTRSIFVEWTLRFLAIRLSSGRHFEQVVPFSIWILYGFFFLTFECLLVVPFTKLCHWVFYQVVPFTAFHLAINFPEWMVPFTAFHLATNFPEWMVRLEQICAIQDSHPLLVFLLNIGFY